MTWDNNIFPTKQQLFTSSPSEHSFVSFSAHLNLCPVLFVSCAPLSPAVPLSSAPCPHWGSVFLGSPTAVCPHWVAPGLTHPAEPRGREWSDKHQEEPWSAVQNSWVTRVRRSAPPTWDAQRHQRVEDKSLFCFGCFTEVFNPLTATKL